MLQLTAPATMALIDIVFSGDGADGFRLIRGNVFLLAENTATRLDEVHISVVLREEVLRITIELEEADLDQRKRRFGPDFDQVNACAESCAGCRGRSQ
jgi:hypothetical protein